MGDRHLIYKAFTYVTLIIYEIKEGRTDISWNKRNFLMSTFEYNVLTLSYPEEKVKSLPDINRSIINRSRWEIKQKDTWNTDIIGRGCWKNIYKNFESG